jgi:hypothetical protein
MSQPEIEMADVQIILKSEWQSRHQEAAKQLEALGMFIEGANEDAGEIEGVISIDKLAALKKLDFVAYVRTVFKYDEERDTEESGPDEDGQTFEPL